MKKLIRWLVVLPAALLAVVIASFLLHIVLYQTLTGSGIIEPYPETPERVLLPLSAAMAFVWVGVKVAPSHKFYTAVVLFSLWILLLGGMVALALSGANVAGEYLYLQGGGLAPVMALIGAFASLYIAWRQNGGLISTARDK